MRDRGLRVDAELAGLARAREDRATRAFLDGYFAAPDVDVVLPASPHACSAVLDAFLFDKAPYEVGYEQAQRPG